VKTTVARWSVRILKGLLLLLLVFLLFSSIYARLRDRQVLQAPPPDGDPLVDLDGRRIHLHLTGKDNPGPAVILLPCFTCASEVWQAVQPELGRTARVYSYDFAGFGWSDAPPAPLTPTRIADDLHRALLALGEKEIVLVGFSGGGISAYNYYQRYPHDPRVVGLVWAEGDALSPEEIAGYDNQLPMPRWLLSGVIELGLWRLSADAFFARPAGWLERIPARYHAQTNAAYMAQIAPLVGTARTGYAAIDMIEAFPADVRRTAQYPPRADVPLFILDADYAPTFAGLQDPAEIEALRKLEASRQQWYRAFAASSPDGHYIPVQDSSHYVVTEHPDIVIQTIRELLARVQDR